MDRRQFLATGTTLAATVSGGCVGCATAPTLTLSMEETSNGDIAARLTTSLDPADDDHRIALDATEDTVTTTGIEEPFPADTPYSHEDAVYTAETTIVDRTPGTAFQYTIDPVDEDATFDPENEVPYEQLPDADKNAFAERNWESPEPFLGFSTSVHYLDEAVDDSVLVPEPEFDVIAWPETRGRFEVDGQRDQPLKTYEYTADVVAEPIEAYGREVRELVAVELDSLDDDAAAVVDEAIDDSPYAVPAEDDLSAAESAIVDRFEDEEQVRRPNESPRDSTAAGGEYVAQYNERVYWTEIH